MLYEFVYKDFVSLQNFYFCFSIVVSHYYECPKT